MSTNEYRIEGALLVLNPDKRGASVVVPRVEGRPRLETLKARRDRVVLVDANGAEHVLDDANPIDAQAAAALGTMILHEMSIEDQNDFTQHELATDIDLTMDSDHDAGGGPTP